MNTIPFGYVTRSFAMNPDTDDLLFGNELTEGMVVLVEDHLFYEDPLILNKKNPSEYAVSRLNEKQRWCRIERFANGTERDLVSFVGVYADGTKRVRTYNKSYAWFVKKDSIPSDV